MNLILTKIRIVYCYLKIDLASKLDDYKKVSVNYFYDEVYYLVTKILASEFDSSQISI